MFTDRTFLAARRWSNREIATIARCFTGSVVNVSGWDDRDKEGRRYEQYFSRASQYQRTNYPGDRGYRGDPNEVLLDLTAELPSELRGRYDVAFNHTTLEHIFDVRKAFANLCAISRDVVIVVVPFSQLQHESASWGDYWRFTPTCLRRLFQENGLTTIYEAESPTRNAAIYLIFVGSRHPECHLGKLPKYRPIQQAGKWIGASLLNSGVAFLTYHTRRALNLPTE